MERHSTWEPTTEPYRTKVYGEAGSYNYAAIYEYCDQYYKMSRLLESDAINERTLSACDVLIVKTPTSRYSTDEVQAIVDYVEAGGSLLLIGDHTNVFNMNTYLNDISRNFGFSFRDDLLFRIGDPYKQRYVPPSTAHPIVQGVPPMNFAVSCSIDPGRSWGTMVIRNTGLYNLGPAYHESNYHPQAEYQPEMQYGAWCQMWATTYGQGRVVAFADSTLFSNFCVFQPGKKELFMGMIHWLNRTSWLDPFPSKFALTVVLLSLGIALIGAGLVRLRTEPAVWIPLAAACCCAWSLASVATTWYGRTAMAPPTVERPMPMVTIDRQLSMVPLFTGAFADDPDGLGYGMLEQWIPRVGNCIERRTGSNLFAGDGLVVICPTRPASEDYRQQLMQFVANGGRLLVFDSPDVDNSTANSILWPFGLASNRNVPQPLDLPLRLGAETTEVVPEASCGIGGGEPLAQWGETVVAATTRYGEGTVTAIGCGSLFNDGNMGFHWLAEPDADTLARYEVLYALLRKALPHEQQSAPR
jgi:hypothetical protein